MVDPIGMVEAERVREIIREEVERFAQHVTALQAAPLVTAMRDHAENVRAAELERFTSPAGRARRRRT